MFYVAKPRVSFVDCIMVMSLWKGFPKYSSHVGMMVILGMLYEPCVRQMHLASSGCPVPDIFLIPCF